MSYGDSASLTMRSVSFSFGILVWSLAPIFLISSIKLSGERLSPGMMYQVAEEEVQENLLALIINFVNDYKIYFKIMK